MKKRILSLLVALLMVVQLFSITALATDRTEEELTAEVIAEETVDHTIPAATEETAATSAEADAPAIPDAGDKPEAPETPEDSEIPEEPVAESKWQKGAESHWVNPMFKNSPALSNNDLSNAGDPIDRDLTMSDFTIHEKDIVAELSTAMVERKELVYLYYETYDMLTEEDLEDLLYKATVPSPYDHPSISNRSYGDYLMFSILEYAYTVEYIEMNGNYYNLILFGVSYLTTAEQEQELANRVVQIESEIYKDGLTRNSPEYLQLKEN